MEELRKIVNFDFDSNDNLYVLWTDGRLEKVGHVNEVFKPQAKEMVEKTKKSANNNKTLEK